MTRGYRIRAQVFRPAATEYGRRSQTRGTEYVGAGLQTRAHPPETGGKNATSSPSFTLAVIRE